MVLAPSLEQGERLVDMDGHRYSIDVFADKFLQYGPPGDGLGLVGQARQADSFIAAV